MCDEGFSSSLAAASLQAAGLVNATDMEGGFQRWLADGCPVTLNNPPAPPRVAHYDARVGAQGSHQRSQPDRPTKHFRL